MAKKTSPKTTRHLKRAAGKPAKPMPSGKAKKPPAPRKAGATPRKTAPRKAAPPSCAKQSCPEASRAAEDGFPAAGPLEISLRVPHTRRALDLPGLRLGSLHSPHGPRAENRDAGNQTLHALGRRTQRANGGASLLHARRPQVPLPVLRFRLQMARPHGLLPHRKRKSYRRPTPRAAEIAAQCQRPVRRARAEIHPAGGVLRLAGENQQTARPGQPRLVARCLLALPEPQGTQSGLERPVPPHSLHPPFAPFGTRLGSGQRPIVPVAAVVRRTAAGAVPAKPLASRRRLDAGTPLHPS